MEKLRNNKTKPKQPEKSIIGDVHKFRFNRNLCFIQRFSGLSMLASLLHIWMTVACINVALLTSFPQLFTFRFRGLTSVFHSVELLFHSGFPCLHNTSVNCYYSMMTLNVITWECVLGSHRLSPKRGSRRRSRSRSRTRASRHGAGTRSRSLYASLRPVNRRRSRDRTTASAGDRDNTGYSLLDLLNSSM